MSADDPWAYVTPDTNNTYRPTHEDHVVGHIHLASDIAFAAKKAFVEWNGRLFAVTACGPVHMGLSPFTKTVEGTDQ